jgi:hypothetical protein
MPRSITSPAHQNSDVWFSPSPSKKSISTQSHIPDAVSLPPSSTLLFPLPTSHFPLSTSSSLLSYSSPPFSSKFKTSLYKRTMLSKLRLSSLSSLRGVGISSIYSRGIGNNVSEFVRPPTTFAQVTGTQQPILLSSRIFATEATSILSSSLSTISNTANIGTGTGSGSGEGGKGKKKSRKLAVVGALGITIAGIYVVDLLLNDDWDTFTDGFRTRLPEEERKKRPRLIILGGGWGALSMLRKLHTDQFNVTVISPRNYFLFTPLLPSTTTGELDGRSIIEPIRNYCKRAGAFEAEFIEAECISVDPTTQVTNFSSLSSFPPASLSLRLLPIP